MFPVPISSLKNLSDWIFKIRIVDLCKIIPCSLKILSLKNLAGLSDSFSSGQILLGLCLKRFLKICSPEVQ